MANEENLIPAKKGDIRNPKGKPPGTRNRSTIARKVLEMMAFLPEKDYESLKELFPEIEKTMTTEEVMTIVQAGKAMGKSDTMAYNALMDSAYGKPDQKNLNENMDVDITSMTDEEKRNYLKDKLNKLQLNEEVDADENAN